MPNGTTVRASRKSVNARLAITQLDNVLRWRKPITDSSTRRFPNRIHIGSATSPRNSHRLSTFRPASKWGRLIVESPTGRRSVGSRNGRTVRLLDLDAERSALNSTESDSLWLSAIQKLAVDERKKVELLIVPVKTITRLYSVNISRHWSLWYTRHNASTSHRLRHKNVQRVMRDISVLQSAVEHPLLTIAARLIAATWAPLATRLSSCLYTAYILSPWRL